MQNNENLVQAVAALIPRLRDKYGLDENGEKLGSPDGLKYVIYARRSTKKRQQKDKQARSIGDQISDCRKLAKAQGLRVVEIIGEELSAKISDQRPQFRAMLDAIKHGDYDGIITWAPDRLARNMREAGEIIDLLDHGVIRDIRFANHFMFSNDDTGKMLLGITFVMAKQYSDQHSKNISRTHRNKTLEGKWAGSGRKHGYYRDEHG